MNALWSDCRFAVRGRAIPARVAGMLGRTVQLVVDRCPICGERHVHGDSPERVKPGARIPRGVHCSERHGWYMLEVVG